MTIPSPDRAPSGARPASDEDLVALTRELRRLARRLVSDDASADDLVQEAWLIALEDSAGSTRNIVAWLRTILRNLALRKARRESRCREIEERVAREESVSSETELVEQM